MIQVVNYYEILELSRSASQTEIKAAYKKMAAVVHPDKGGSAMLFRLVQEAYEVLTDPVKRKQHDSDLDGPNSAGSHPGSQNNQQQQSQTSQSEPNYVRVEDAYKRWKENRSRAAMPRSESYTAGGVRKMIRESSPYFLEDPNRFCGNCGWDLPVSFDDKLTGYKQGQDLGVCDRCNQSRGILCEIVITPDQSQNQWLNEELDIESGDLLWFFNWKFIRGRASFGYVVEGFARNEYGLRNLKVLDEFSGQLVTPNAWKSVMGHWKSNDLSKNRTGLLRNWSF